MSETQHPLRTWLAENRETITAFSARVGFAQSFLSEILARKKAPSMQMARRIRDATGGQVSADAFMAPAPKRGGKRS